MSDAHKRLVQKALQEIVAGRGVPAGRQEPSHAASLREQAQELLGEIDRPQLRSGFLLQAQSLAEEYFRAVGRLAPSESLTDPLEIKVRNENGRDNVVKLHRMQTVGDVRRAGNTAGGLLLSGRQITDSELLFDLWLRDGLGAKVMGSTAPVIQVVVQNVGG